MLFPTSVRTLVLAARTILVGCTTREMENVSVAQLAVNVHNKNAYLVNPVPYVLSRTACAEDVLRMLHRLMVCVNVSAKLNRTQTLAYAFPALLVIMTVSVKSVIDAQWAVSVLKKAVITVS